MWDAPHMHAIARDDAGGPIALSGLEVVQLGVSMWDAGKDVEDADITLLRPRPLSICSGYGHREHQGESVVFVIMRSEFRTQLPSGQWPAATREMHATPRSCSHVSSTRTLVGADDVSPGRRCRAWHGTSPSPRCYADISPHIRF